VSFKIIMSTSVTIVFHNTTPDLQDQDHSVQRTRPRLHRARPRPIFLCLRPVLS